VRLQPNWSGEMLDLWLICHIRLCAGLRDRRERLLLPYAAPFWHRYIRQRGALFRRSPDESVDNIFADFRIVEYRGIYLSAATAALPSSVGVAVLIASTFLPFHVVNPIRVVRMRALTCH